MARPKKKDAKRKNFKFRVNDEEYKWLLELSEKYGMPRSELIFYALWQLEANQK